MRTDTQEVVGTMKQIFFTAPFDAQSARHQAKRADDHLQQLGAGWICTLPDGTPAQTSSQEFEARTDKAELVQDILARHYGFTISRTDEL